MTDLSQDTLLLAARELLLSFGQQRTTLTGEQQAHLQEAIEHVESVQRTVDEEQ